MGRACAWPCLPSGFPSSSHLPVHPSPGSVIGAPRLPRHLGAPGREKARCVPPWEPWSKPQGALSQLPTFHRLPNTMHFTLGVSVFFFFFVTVICITLKTHDSSFELENKVTPRLRPVCVSQRKWTGNPLGGRQPVGSCFRSRTLVSPAYALGTGLRNG